MLFLRKSDPNVILNLLCQFFLKCKDSLSLKIFQNEDCKELSITFDLQEPFSLLSISSETSKISSGVFSIRVTPSSSYVFDSEEYPKFLEISSLKVSSLLF